MPRPKTLTLTLAIDADGICASQSPAGAGNLTLDGALVGADISRPTYYTTTTAQQIGVTSDGDDSGNTFTVTGSGYDANSVWYDSISESIAGPNATTTESTYFYTEITSIAIGGAAVGNITVGTVDEAITGIFQTGGYNDIGTNLQTVVTGTINYTIHYTLSDVQDSTVTPSWVAASTDMTTATAGQTTHLDGNLRGIRGVVHSGNDAGAVALNIVQQ